MSNFSVFNKHGFSIKFDNGYEVSVNFGKGNYCNNRYEEIDILSIGDLSCENSEIAVYKDNNMMYLDFMEHGIASNCTVNDFLEIANKVSAL